MRANRIVLSAFLFVVCTSLVFGVEKSKTSKVLSGVKVVQVEPTIVGNPEKVKEEHAPILLADSLRNALKFANFEIGESPIRAHIVLDEFTSGSTAKRFLVGFGAGRSTVDCRLVIQDSEGKELFSKKIRVRGNLVWSPYQGNNTQRRQAVTSFEQRLLEEIEALKSPEDVSSAVAKESKDGEVKPAAKKETGMLAVTSEPSGAEVYVDGEFSGHTPCKLTVDAGKHTIKVTAKEFKEWSREMTVREGSEMTVNAGLEKAAEVVGQ